MDSIETTHGDASEFDEQWILRELNVESGSLPEEALRAAQEHREIIAPRLLELLNKAIDGAKNGFVPEGNAHFFAWFLLLEFEYKPTLPSILEVIGLPKDLQDDLFGDALSETMTRTLTVFFENSPELLDSLIRDGDLDEFSRWHAAAAYVYLVRDGRLKREEAVERLRQHLCQATDDEDIELVGPLVYELSRLSAVEALGEIETAFEQDLVEQLLVTREEVLERIERGEPAMRAGFERLGPSKIEDTVEELRTWAGFREELERPPQRSTPSRQLVVEEPESPADDAETFGHFEASELRIGRNAPCPCGSGKKFKKCCGSPAARRDLSE